MSGQILNPGTNDRMLTCSDVQFDFTDGVFEPDIRSRRKNHLDLYGLNINTWLCLLLQCLLLSIKLGEIIDKCPNKPDIRSRSATEAVAAAREIGNAAMHLLGSPEEPSQAL